jgi:hypothetical protein
MKPSPGTRTGFFNGLPDGSTVPLGQGFTATIQYGSTFVRLINPVPEPAHVLALCALGAGVAAWARKRRTK